MMNGVEEVLSEPVSPTAQYFNSSVLSVSVICVLEAEKPIDDSLMFSLINDVFLPINPRFSSIMVKEENGPSHWKKVEVKIEDHIIIPRFPKGLSLDTYTVYFNDYLSKIAMEPLPQTRPLWEIHIFKYPTSNAAGNLVFKLSHALGDGFSLMGALLTCLQRADDPSLPLTFPNFQKGPKTDNEAKSFSSAVPQALSGVLNTISDFGWSLMKSSFLEDDRTPIRSGDQGVEFRPINITTMTFCLDQIKQIKTSLQVSINDVITGVIFLGTRLYMEAASHDSRNSNSTALVLLNTRSIGGYKSVKEMVQNKEAQTQWGNQFGFLHVSIPELHKPESLNPLEFVYEARNIIKRKRNSSSVYLTGKLLETLRKYRGPEATAEYIHSTLKNSSMTVSNLIGPLERMTLSNQPVKGLYFMVVNIPQNLTITVLSYMKQLRVAVGAEKGLIDPEKFKKCIEKSFDMMFKAAVDCK